MECPINAGNFEYSHADDLVGISVERFKFYNELFSELSELLKLFRYYTIHAIERIVFVITK